MTKQELRELSEAELESYSRQIVLPEIGYKGQLKLKNAKVCIAGLGGLGSLASLQLAAMGVGHIRLVDYDVVELSNLQRQLLYSHCAYADNAYSNRPQKELHSLFRLYVQKRNGDCEQSYQSSKSSNNLDQP